MTRGMSVIWCDFMVIGLLNFKRMYSPKIMFYQSITLEKDLSYTIVYGMSFRHTFVVTGFRICDFRIKTGLIPVISMAGYSPPACSRQVHEKL
jgi:hypothetical protein